MINLRELASKRTITILVILACALALRLYNLNHSDLWFDELSTDQFSSQSIAKFENLSGASQSQLIIDRMKNDPHSFLYYGVVYFYSAFFGDGKSLRILSMIFSMLSLMVFYKLSRVFFNRSVSVGALFLMAVHPFHIWYAQEARAYAMTSFLSLLTIYVYTQALKTDKRRFWAMFSVFGVLSVYSSYNAVLLLFASGVVFVFKDYRRHVWKWMIAMSTVGLSLALLQSLLLGQLSFVKSAFWIPEPSITTLLDTWMFFTLGYSASVIQYQIALPVFFIMFMGGVYSSLRESKVNAILLFSLLFIPIVLTYTLSKFITPIYIHRQLLIFSPFYYLFIVRGIASIRNTKILTLVIVYFAIIMMTPVMSYYQGHMIYDGNRPMRLLGVFQKKNYTSLLKQMSAQYEEGDYIAAADLQSYVITRSHLAKNHKNYNEVPFQIFSFLSYPKQQYNFDRRYLGINELIDGMNPEDLHGLYGFAFLHDGRVGLKRVELDDNQFQRIWLISSNWKTTDPVEPNYTMLKRDLNHYFSRVSAQQRDGFRIELYMRLKGK